MKISPKGHPAKYDYIRNGAEIYAQSVATIRAEADKSAFSEEQAPVVVRIIHACGMVSDAQHVVM
ncbi:precorrin-8X methylmutase, partial [Neokomagataea anthophila]